MNESELEQSILNFIALAEYRPMKPRAIAKHLKVPDEQIALVKRAIKRMVHHGQLQYGSNHLVMAADTAVKPGTEPGKTRPGRIAGVFQRTKKGFGFVRPHGATAEDREKTDIYIPADRAGDASTGDTVLVQLLKHRPGEPGLRGEVVEIIERETHQFVGTYFEARAPGTCRSTARCSRNRSTWAILGRKTPRSTTRWSSRWSASLRPFMTAKE